MGARGAGTLAALSLNMEHILIPYSELFVVGFNGIAKGACSYDSAVVRYQPAPERAGSSDPSRARHAAHNEIKNRPWPGCYFKLTFTNIPLQDKPHPSRSDTDIGQAPTMYPVPAKTIFRDESEIKAFREDEGLTLFEPGQEFSAFHNARVLYVTQSLLDAASIKLPDYLQGREVNWLRLPATKEPTWATCLDKEAIFGLMNSWGRALMNRCLGQLIDYFAPKDKDERLRENAEYLSELGFGIARDRALRSDMLKFSGVAKMSSPSPRPLHNLYFFSVKPEFPDLSWEAFLEHLNRVRDIIRVRAQEGHPVSIEDLYRRGAVLPGSQLPEQVLSYPQTEHESLLAMSKLSLEERVSHSVGEVQGVKDEIERMAKAIEVAEAYAQHLPPKPEDAASVLKMLERQPDSKRGLKLDHPTLKVFASDPFFHLCKDARHYLVEEYVDLYLYGVFIIDFNNANKEDSRTKEYLEKMKPLSPLAKSVLESYSQKEAEAAAAVG